MDCGDREQARKHVPRSLYPERGAQAGSRKWVRAAGLRRSFGGIETTKTGEERTEETARQPRDGLTQQRKECHRSRG